MNNYFRLSNRCRILVIGDVMLDRYVTGNVNRISPEAPIPILSALTRNDVLGGAANVANNIKALGCNVQLIGIAGHDTDADELMALLVDSDIIPIILQDDTRPTTVKTRFISNGHQMLRVDNEDNKPVAKLVEDSLILHIRDAIQTSDIIILSDYAKGVLTDKIIATTISAAKDKTVIVDPKRNFNHYKNASIITPNEKELMTGTGLLDLNKAAKKALDDSGANALVVTRSEKGVALFVKDSEPVFIPAVTREVVDVSGAGDTMVATLAAFLAIGTSLVDALVIANRAAGIVVGKRGTASVSLAELKLQNDDGKIADLSTATDIIKSWKKQGLKIGFTNGCFDLVHPGHINMLRKARAKCDRLIVGLNSDASVKRLKGETRPIQTEDSRATVISGMAAVDLVVIFEDDTPINLIETLTPNMLFKGADYKPDQIVGAGWVKQHGGEVKVIELDEGHSTSGLIKKIG